jgi:5S rRNA maturation endonuclease (ribonuclease M5)
MIVAGDGREPLLELPVSIHGREVGSVKCRVRKVEGQLSYINEKAKGNGWSKDALFPFDYVESLEPDVVTIVEGPRDALVNIANGLPSLATLGSTAWSAKCASLVKSLAPKMLLIMADPDGAGDQLVSKVYADLSDFMHVIRINLPFHMEERGGKQVKVKDLDPANLNRRMLRKILDRAGVPRTYLPDLFRVRIAS